MSDPEAEIGTDEDVRLVDEAVRRALVIPQIQAAAAALGEELLGYPVPMMGVSTEASASGSDPEDAGSNPAPPTTIEAGGPGGRPSL